MFIVRKSRRLLCQLVLDATMPTSDVSTIDWWPLGSRKHIPKMCSPSFDSVLLFMHMDALKERNNHVLNRHVAMAMLLLEHIREDGLRCGTHVYGHPIFYFTSIAPFIFSVIDLYLIVNWVFSL